MNIFADTEEIKSAIGKEEVVYEMLKQHKFNRMFLEVQLGKGILDFVIELFGLYKSDFALA